MKKFKLIIASLLITTLSYSQVQDTICHSFAGKIHFEFDYYKSKIINKDTTKSLEDRDILINKNQFLVVDLYDNCKCVVNQNFIKERKIVIYFRNGEIKTYKNNSGEALLYFDGLEVKKIIVKKPLLKNAEKNNYKRS